MVSLIDETVEVCNKQKTKNKDKKKQRKWNHGMAPTHNNSQQHKPAAFLSKTFNPNNAVEVNERDTRLD
jgi:hypothetical protein